MRQTSASDGTIPVASQLNPEAAAVIPGSAAATETLANHPDATDHQITASYTGLSRAKDAVAAKRLPQCWAVQNCECKRILTYAGRASSRTGLGKTPDEGKQRKVFGAKLPPSTSNPQRNGNRNSVPRPPDYRDYRASTDDYRDYRASTDDYRDCRASTDDYRDYRASTDDSMPE